MNDDTKALPRGRARRLEVLGFANGVVFLAVLAFLLFSSPLPLPPARIAALAVLAGCVGVAYLLRRRFWITLEAELEHRKRAEQEARAADQAKGRFLANIGHEIRTPMNGILGMTELVLRGPLTPAQREQIGVARTSAEALLALVDDILDLARIDAGRLMLRPRDFRLRELAADVLRLLAPRAAEREVDLRLEVSPRLFDGLHGDPVRLRQVLLNLVGNAIRFTRKGSVTITAEAEVPERKASTVRFEVRDTGVGIRPEVQARLFQPFTQSDSSASRQMGGTGLGLVISRNIVEAMGGEIGFESTRDVGSTFWFRIPLVHALGPGASSWTPFPEPVATVRRLDRHGRRILVVDDRAANRAVALALLHEIGYAAEAVESGEEGLALFAQRAFDAVLLDSEMPGIDGPETCRRLRGEEAEGRRVPVIAVTAHTRPEEREACLAAGMDDFLTKPFQTADLAALLDRWTGIEAVAPSSAEVMGDRLAALKSLEAQTGGNELAQVVEAFLQQGESDLATMRRALPQGDAETLAGAAHGLAGSAAILGATDLAASAGELATLARQGDLSACAERLTRVEQDFHDAAGKL
ncbi:MAG TPA: ATP-binding protein [Thermoanaerobaculia bacterium]|nr:ATP-binding protein [Thermoanaerobaculia bacterium]